MKIDPKRLQRIIIKKVICVAAIVILGIILGIVNAEMAAPLANSISASAGMDVAAGNTNTVQAMGHMQAAGGSLAIGRTICIVLMFIVGFIFVTDICIDIYNFYKKPQEANE